jgi:multicomponent K+:H+ antiporter subunit A
MPGMGTMISYEIVLVGLLLLPILGAISIGLWQRWVCCAYQGWILAGLMAVMFAGGLSLLPQLQRNGSLTMSLSWLPQLGVHFTLYVDGLALLFILLVSGMGSAIMAYGGYYFEDKRQSARFFQLMLVFSSSMLALVMSGSVITLFVAWELTSVISFLLISFKGSDREGRTGAFQALMITGAGGLALLVGLLLIGNAAGSMELAQILNSGEMLRQHPWYTALTVLLMLGAFSKSAQFPLHFWLPGAMSAPTPASAYLHSATMVKAGIFLLMRFYPVLGDTPLWENGLLWVGGLTTLISASLAMWQMDLKGILAYTTISQLGTLVLLIGLPGGIGIKAASLGVLAHALYKGTLFLMVGAVDHATGTRNIRELGHLAKTMPGFAIVTAVVALSMAGTPPLFGFAAKEAFIEAVIDRPWVLGVSLVRVILTVAIALRLFWDVFLRPTRIMLPQEEHQEHDFHHPYGDDAYDYSHHHDLPPGMVIGPALLGVLSILLGPGIGPVLSPLISTVLGKSVKLYLFPPGGINLVMGVSLAALALGVWLFVIRRRWVRLEVPNPIHGRMVFDASIRGFEAVGDWLLTTQNGRIRHYLSLIMLSVVILMTLSVGSLPLTLPQPWVEIRGPNDILKAILLILALSASLASILFKQHLAAVLALGVSGYAVGGLFLLEPAPDVAMVQFLVETLATVLVVLILARTRAQERQAAMERLWVQTRRGRIRDLVIAGLTGLSVTLFALAAVSSRPTPDAVAAWYLRNALDLVGVKDIVGGIITDFRGTDTLLEITVFSLAALGVLTMLARPVPGRIMPLFFRKVKTEPTPVEDAATKAALQEDAERPEPVAYPVHLLNPVNQLAANLILPLAFLIAAAHILYAGINPGDGFTAGVIAGLGIALWYIVFGYNRTKQRLRWLHPGLLIGLGLSVALINALIPLLFGRSFLAFSLLSQVSFADIKLASSFIFEIGIFLAIFGGMCAILEAISHPKEVEPL